jgi:hypothetical protein
MFSVNENEQNISIITVDYHYIPLISFIFYTDWIILVDVDEIEQ